MKTMIGPHVLYCGNSLEIMPTLPPKFADHTIADPPYEDALHDAIARAPDRRADGRKTSGPLGFEPIDAIRDQAMAAIVAATRGWALMFCLAEGAGAWEKAIWKHGAKYDTLCFWHKPDGLPRMNGQGPARACECFSTAWCGTGYRSWNGGGKRGFYSHQVNPRDRMKVPGANGKMVAAHPTEKPLSLMREIILDFTNPGDVVFDPFMGIASTGVACIQTGRRFVGIELQESYYALGVDRMRRALDHKSAQPVLFDAPQSTKQADFGHADECLRVGKKY